MCAGEYTESVRVLKLISLHHPSSTVSILASVCDGKGCKTCVFVDFSM